jgi:hypothetical protein
MRKLRLLHRYMGLFFSPAILFFAFTGALQTFDLHSTNKSTGYVPPAWLVEMAQLHKKQTLNLIKPKSKPTQAEPAAGDSGADKMTAPPRRSSLPLKWFVVVMSVGLIVTTILGIYMAFCFGASPKLVWGILAAGTLLPVAMIFV